MRQRKRDKEKEGKGERTPCVKEIKMKVLHGEIGSSLDFEKRTCVL